MSGHAIYTPRILGVYDLLVMGLTNRFVWRCPTRYMVDHYNRFVSSNHLDVGVGTGLLLDRCQFPGHVPRIVLFDRNDHCLRWTARRVARYRPETVQGDVLQPLNVKGRPFDSVGLNYVLHCLPGTMETKNCMVFRHLRAVMSPGAVVFGATILRQGVRCGWTARRLMALYNARQIFSNCHDGREALQSQLAQVFEDVSIECRGCVALFSARRAQNDR